MGDEDKYIFTRKYGNFKITSSAIAMDGVLQTIINSFEMNPELYKNDEKIVVIMSDGNFMISDEVLSECIDYGITIYTIDVEHGENYWHFERMSTLTGGQYYYGTILDDPDFLWDSIVYDSGDRLEGRDKDGDGLLDVYETEGMRTITGRIITTNADIADTDGDTLTDSEETGPVYDLNLYIGRGIVKSVRFIVPNSDPNNPDTDSDGMNDDVDPYPLKDNMHEVTVHNAYSDIKFLRILSNSSENIYNGGAQSWWFTYRNHNSSDTIENNIDLLTDKKGCGLIAASNLEFFLGQTYGLQSYPYNSSNQFPLWDSNGCISLNDYMNYVDCNRENAYFLKDGNDVPHGVKPVNLCSGFNDYLSYNGIMEESTWADSTDGKEVLKSIKKMIDNNLPTMCGICMGNERIPVNLYGDLNRAINNDKPKPIYDISDCNNHYINIIGYVKIDNNLIDYDYYLIVETDTFIYYVDYDCLSSQWSSVMNVLRYEI